MYYVPGRLPLLAEVWFNLQMRSSSIIALAAVCLASPLVGCHVQFIMDYDSVVDQQLVQVEQETEQFFGHLQANAGTAKASYDNDRDFYIKIAAELRTIRTRVQYEPKSAEVLTQIDALSKSLNDLQSIQMKSGAAGMNSIQIDLAHSPFETDFAAISQLQLALRSKPGAKSANAMVPRLKP